MLPNIQLFDYPVVAMTVASATINDLHNASQIRVLKENPRFTKSSEILLILIIAYIILSSVNSCSTIVSNCYKLVRRCVHMKSFSYLAFALQIGVIQIGLQAFGADNSLDKLTLCLPILLEPATKHAVHQYGCLTSPEVQL